MDLDLIAKIGANREAWRKVAAEYDAIHHAIEVPGNIWFQCKDYTDKMIYLHPNNEEIMAFLSLMLRRLEKEMERLDDEYGLL